MKPFALLLTIFSLSLWLSGCQVEELANADIVADGGEFAFPLGTMTISVEEMLDNFDEFTTIEIGPDEVVHLVYKGDVLTQYAAEFLVEAAQSIPPIIPIIDTNYFVLPFSSPEVLEVDRAIYKSGTVSIAVESLDYTGPVQLKVTLPQVFNNGVPLTFETVFQSPISGSLPGLGQELPGMATDVSGFELIPDNGIVTVEYEAITEGGAGDTIILDVVSLINPNILFSYFEGYLGNEVFNGGRDTIKIDFFENWTQGDVFFEDPRITINITNSFGVPTRSVIDTFDILTTDGNRIRLRSEFIDTVSGIDFAYPVIPGDSATMTFDFDKTNSNIDSVLSSRPVALDYKVSARMNPDTNTALRGFISEESFYRIQVEVDLPLYGRASGFGVTDGFDMDLTGFSGVSEVELKLIADNATPLQMVGQAYFVDGTGVILDSLYDSGPSVIVGAATVDNDGNVVTPATEISFVTFPAQRFEKIKQAEKIMLDAFFSTSDNGQLTVKAQAGQKAEIRMGLMVKKE
ncbi:MAG TPA: hypothetical protein ENJ20_01085 [Bacteroidetes bacterium]|nr:hypothetical protein [Bacteroidota bacterium]